MSGIPSQLLEESLHHFTTCLLANRLLNSQWRFLREGDGGGGAPRLHRKQSGMRRGAATDRREGLRRAEGVSQRRYLGFLAPPKIF